MLCSEDEGDGSTASPCFQEPLSPNSIGSSQSLPSVRMVDGSSDNCSVHSIDIVSDEQQKVKTVPLTASSTSNFSSEETVEV